MALTHPSTFNEEKGGEGWDRLEFLGDAVLELALSEALFEFFPGCDEGALTQRRSSMVNQTHLAKKARELSLGEKILIGKGEEKNGGRNKDSILADAMEALFGAYFLEKGYNKTKKTILELFQKELQESKAAQFDYKSFLQEYSQKNSSYLPVYKVMAERGQPHARMYWIKVSLRGYHSAQGHGTSKKSAEQNAARHFLEKNGLLADVLGK